jgi:hypothetical protein
VGNSGTDLGSTGWWNTTTYSTTMVTGNGWYSTSNADWFAYSDAWNMESVRWTSYSDGNYRCTYISRPMVPTG